MEDNSTCSIIMSSLLTLPPRHFSDLTRTLSSDLRLHRRRLIFLLLSPVHFASTLSHLHSLSLPQKTLLLARLLLRSLSLLLLSHPPRSPMRLRDFDAALLLLTMCEVYDRDEGTVGDWRGRIADYMLRRSLTVDGLGAQGWIVVSRYVDAAVKCRRLLDAISGSGRVLTTTKADADVAASVAAVVALPSVECSRRGWECVVCREEIEVGRDVCVLPCRHGFHWGCILPWLRKKNTCPCCRFELPTDDVFAEIDRVWRSAVRNVDHKTS